jgi:DNA-binding transcriptional MerR regulator
VSFLITEVARLSGVTSRTLRYYGEIGLLPPAGTAGNGYRLYEQQDLLRLQQILLLRELGLGLAEIGQILDEQRDPVQALRGHRERLIQEHSRLGTLIGTVSRTITELTSSTGGAMQHINRPENLFAGFDPSRYEAEARERWPEQWEQSKRVTDRLTAEDTDRMQRESTAAMIRMAELMVAGTPVTDEAVQAEIESTYRSICRMWTPDAAAFAGLGRMYVEDERFTATYDAISPGLAQYYCDAMDVYATAKRS